MSEPRTPLGMILEGLRTPEGFAGYTPESFREYVDRLADVWDLNDDFDWSAA